MFSGGVRGSFGLLLLQRGMVFGWRARIFSIITTTTSSLLFGWRARLFLIIITTTISCCSGGVRGYFQLLQLPRIVLFFSGWRVRLFLMTTTTTNGCFFRVACTDTFNYYYYYE